MLLCSMKKPEFIFSSNLLISVPDDAECGGEQQTRAQGICHAKWQLFHMRC